MGALERLLRAVDRWQRRHTVAGVVFGVLRKFGDDNANLQVVSLGWYGFTAVFPLLLVVVTILGFVGERSLGNGIVSTLHQFPVIGSEFNPASSSRLQGSSLGLAIGVLGLLYGAQGVTNTAQGAMAEVWNVPKFERTGFLPRLGRSFLALLFIGGTLIVNASVAAYATGGGEPFVVRALVVGGQAILNCLAYYATFRTLTPRVVESRPLIPGAILGGVGFTLLITAGAGLLTHQLKNTSNTYGTFGSVIGVVAFLLLVAKLTLYAAELNPVLERRLYPRALPFGELTAADRQILADLSRQEQQRKDQHIEVRFGPRSIERPEDDLSRGVSAAGPVSEHPVSANGIPGNGIPGNGIPTNGIPADGVSANGRSRSRSQASARRRRRRRLHQSHVRGARSL